MKSEALRLRMTRHTKSNGPPIVAIEVDGLDAPADRADDRVPRSGSGSRWPRSWSGAAWPATARRRLRPFPGRHLRPPDGRLRLRQDDRAGQAGRERLFLELIVQAEPTGRMPKDADPLPKAEVDILRRWIEQGAKSDGLDPNAELTWPGRPGESARRPRHLPDARADLGPRLPARRGRAGGRRLSRSHDLGPGIDRASSSDGSRPGPADARAGLQRRWLACWRSRAGHRGSRASWFWSTFGEIQAAGCSPPRPTSCWPWRSARMGRWSPHRGRPGAPRP